MPDTVDGFMVALDPKALQFFDEAAAEVRRTAGIPPGVVASSFGPAGHPLAEAAAGVDSALRNALKRLESSLHDLGSAGRAGFTAYAEGDDDAAASLRMGVQA